MAAADSKPRVCFEFEVEKVIGISNDGNYQVQWAPAWVSKFHLVGCEHLIQEFMEQQMNQIKVEPEVQFRKSQLQSEVNGTEIYEDGFPEQQSVCDSEPRLEILEQTCEIIPTEPYIQGFSPQQEFQQQQVQIETKTEPEYEDEILDQTKEIDAMVEFAQQQAAKSHSKDLQAEIGGSTCERTIETKGTNSNKLLSFQPSSTTVEALQKRTCLGIERDLPIKHVPSTNDAAGASNEEISKFNEGRNTPEIFSCRTSALMLLSAVAQQNNNELSGLTNKTSNTNSKHTCGVCHKEFSATGEHRTHHGRLAKKLLKCPHCSAMVNQCNVLEHDIRVQTPRQFQTCSYCSKYFTRKSDLDRHLRTHSGEFPCTCEICGKSFRQSSHLKSHMSMHTAGKPCSCSICESEFQTNEELKQHLQTHGVMMKPFQCVHCEKSFSQSRTLIEHVQVVHMGEKPYCCSVCGKEFSFKSTYGKHIKSCSIPKKKKKKKAR